MSLPADLQQAIDALNAAVLRAVAVEDSAVALIDKLPKRYKIPLNASTHNMPITVTRVIKAAPPPPPTGTGLPWVAKPLPVASPYYVVHDPSTAISAIGNLSGGCKHQTCLYCPDDGMQWVFGGDFSGASTVAELNSPGPKLFPDDNSRNEIWTYDPTNNVWTLKMSGDVPAGQIHPNRPDWGKFAWDSTRHLFWFHVGGSNLGIQGHGIAPFLSSSGLTWTYGHSADAWFWLPPDLTHVTMPGSLTLTNNATNYIEYNPATHLVQFNTTAYTGGSVIPLYRQTTAGGVCTTRISDRSYWAAFGQYDDPTDPRHYADPRHLLSLDPTTMLWTDHPEYSTMEADYPTQVFTSPDGNVASTLYNSMGMIYDPTGDQLICLHTTWAMHFSFATGHWTKFNYTGYPSPSGWANNGITFDQTRFWLDVTHRVIYAIDGSGKYITPNAQYNWNIASAWSYDIVTHVVTQLISPIPDTQQGLVVFEGGAGVTGMLAGGKYLDNATWHDPVNEILWWCETTHGNLNLYNYQDSGTIQHMHAWHYQENRIEEVFMPIDSDNVPHLRSQGFDPVQNVILGFNHNADNTDPASVYYPTREQCEYRQYVYQWTPSGFTKPTWSTMP